MIPSDFDGQAVTYVDFLQITHTGVIVGQSADGAWLYVQSDRDDAPPREWHFKVRPSLMDALTAPSA